MKEKLLRVHGTIQSAFSLAYPKQSRELVPLLKHFCEFNEKFCEFCKNSSNISQKTNVFATIFQITKLFTKICKETKIFAIISQKMTVFAKIVQQIFARFHRRRKFSRKEISQIFAIICQFLPNFCFSCNPYQDGMQKFLD